MYPGDQKVKMFHFLAVIISILFLFQTILILLPEENIFADGEEIEIDMDSVPNFDIQFMIEPDMDPLSPLKNQKWARISPGSNAVYWIMIINMGPVNDTYHIQLAEPPRNAGWNWYFYDSGSLSVDVYLTSPHIRDLVGGISFRSFRILVEAPVDATRDTRYPFKVSAVSESLFSDIMTEVYEDHDEMIFLVGEHCYLHLPSMRDTMYYMDPGEFLTIPIPYTNLGNKDVIDIEIKIIENDFWRTSYRYYEDIYIPNFYLLDFNWTEKEVTVPQGETVFEELRVRVNPEFSGEDDIFQFRIFASIKYAPNFYSSEVITIIINKYTSLMADVNGGDHIDIVPGEETHANLSIRNTGWSDDSIKMIYLLDPKGVKVAVYNETGNVTDKFDVPRIDTRIMDIGFILLEDLPPGVIERELFIKPMYDDPIVLTVSLNVLEKTDMKILSPDAFYSEIIEMGPGEEKSLTFGVRNNGNTEKTVRLDLMRAMYVGVTSSPAALDKNWSSQMEWISNDREPAYLLEFIGDEQTINTSSFDDYVGYTLAQRSEHGRELFSIEPSETIWVSLRIKSPGGDGEKLISPYPVKVVLSSSSDKILNGIDLVIEVKYPDIHFNGLLELFDENGDAISSADSEERVFFSINVTNVGEWYSERTCVNILADDEKIDEIWIIPLAPGQTTIMIGNFTAVGNTKRIELEIDPFNDLVEFDDQFMEGSTTDANIIRAPLRVDEEKSLKIGTIIAIIILVIFVIGVIAVGSSVFIWIYKGKMLPLDRDQ